VQNGEIRQLLWQTKAKRAIEDLPAEERAEAELLLRELYGYQPLPEFIVEISPTLPPPPHVRYLCKRIEDARANRRRFCLSWPPRHAKTTAILYAFAWWLKHSPADTCGYYTYSDRKGRSKSRVARELAMRAGVQLLRDSRGMDEWRTLQGGGLLAGGVGGGLTGQGISGLMVVDDPFKNRQEADSITRRETIWEWFNEVVITRLEGASVVVIHTRWHEDDLIGRLGDMGWEIINIPAIAGIDDPIGRSLGSPLWPERFPVEELESIKRQIGPWSWAALYDGLPRPRGTQVFGRPTFYEPESLKLDGMTIVIGADPAASESTASDYSAAVVLGVRNERNEETGKREAVAYILDVYREQVSVPQFAEDLVALQRRWYGAGIVVEAVAGFKAVPQLLLRIAPGIDVVEAPMLGDKYQRAQPASHFWNQGRLRVPARAPWLRHYLTEVQIFTGVNDKHDDQVDGTAHAFNELINPSTGRIVRGGIAAPGRWK
jgi:predicted phage terminase large subunit-like protein